MPAGVLGFEAAGKVGAEDYTEVLAPALELAKAEGGKLRVVFVFSGEFDGMEAGGGLAGPQDRHQGLGRMGTGRPRHRQPVVARRREHVRLGDARRGQGIRGRRT